MIIDFSNRIKELRLEKHLNQQELANILNTTQRKISYWENGKVEPDLKTLCLLADYFDVSVDYLIGRRDF